MEPVKLLADDKIGNGLLVQVPPWALESLAHLHFTMCPINERFAIDLFELFGH